MKDNYENDFYTIPLFKVFNSRVFVDQETGVLYDSLNRMAIGFIKYTHTTMEVTIILPDFVDKEFKVCSEFYTDYFNQGHVIKKENRIFYKMGKKYLLIGTIYKNVNLTIKLPRFVNNRDGVPEEVDTSDFVFED